MENKQKGKEKYAYSVPHILEKHVDGHVTAGIDGETSKGQRHGMVIDVVMCTWGTGGGRKEKDLSRG